MAQDKEINELLDELDGGATILFAMGYDIEIILNSYDCSVVKETLVMNDYNKN